MLHEKLICYQKSLLLAQSIHQETVHCARGYSNLIDQIKRAMTSVVLNLAEGNAKFTNKERKHFFTISRASLVEVSAGLDLLSTFNLINHQKVITMKTQAEIISKAIYKLR